MASEQSPPCIYVIAGTNGAGKSSVIGAAIVESGADYFNPDAVAQSLLAAHASLTQQDANSQAWQHGVRRLEQAIARKLTFAFETTLGGRTIPRLLHEASAAGIDVKMWFIALATADLHIERVRARVASGGHHIASAAIRERYDRSRQNLVLLLPVLAELRVFDNSVEADPRRGQAPQPVLVLHTARGRIEAMCQPTDVPEWAKPLVVAALRVMQPL